MFSADEFHTISLMEVVSWRLHADGTLTAMVAEESDPVETPVLPAPNVWFPTGKEDFRYFFQHGIANKLKERTRGLAAVVSWQPNGHAMNS